MKVNNRQLKRIFRGFALGVYLGWLVLSADQAAAQVRPVNDYGAMGIQQLLRKLNNSNSVMMIGAHPDDEDSALLAYLFRHDQARTAYLSLTRGDGGQNIIGSDLFESLGVIRTEELLQARRLDGAQQLFARAFDYGFSKTLAEAKSKWDEKVLLCDVVRAIRTFQPLVVIARFSGTPADGHGQHQFAGYIAPMAVKAAADPGQCTESGMPWPILKFYVEQGFSDSAQPGLRLNTGEYDPVTGRSYFEIAMEGRSQHKSQGEGRLELHGDQFSGLNLKESLVPKVEKETSIFDGIEDPLKFVLAGDKSEAKTRANEQGEMQEAARAALENFQPGNPKKILPQLLRGLAVARRLVKGQELRPELAQKEQEFTEAIARILGVRIDALADRETVVPGEKVFGGVKVFFPKDQNIKVTDISMKVPGGWDVAKTEEPKEQTQGFFRRETGNAAAFFNVTAPRNAKLTQPYWLDDPRDGDLFRWPAGDDQNLPFQPPLVEAQVKIEIEGQEIALTKPLQYRYADEARGEIRRELNVVPALSLSLDQKLLIVPESDKPQTRRVVLTVENHSEKGVAGQTGLNVHTSPEWRVASANAGVDLKKKGAKASVSFDITIPAKTKPGAYSISAYVGAGEGLATNEMHLLSYPHIQTHRYYTRAAINVSVLDLKVAPVKVGYIMGSGDEVPEAIRQMGLDVKLLDETEVGSGDLAKYDVIVVGVRASEVRPDFVAHTQTLYDYVKNGGTLIVQYQRPVYAQQGLSPFPVTMGARVVDENAKVTILQPAHPVFNFPNKIADADFAGWVQERNAYNFNTFDEKYTPLLEAHDAGEPENKGGLVVAEMGKGKYVYCSYSMFRQLPSGVGGAYRLFANMLSLPKARK